MRFGCKLFRTYVSLIRDNCNFHCLYGNESLALRAIFNFDNIAIAFATAFTYPATINFVVTITLLTTAIIIN